MIQLYDFDSCLVNERNGTYGGMAGDKEGITFQGDYWIIKYPKSTKVLTKVGQKAFSKCGENCKIKVPKAQKKVYQKKLKNKIGKTAVIK